MSFENLSKAVSEGQPKDYYLSDEEFNLGQIEQTPDSYYEKMKAALESMNMEMAERNARALQNVAKQAGLWQKYRDIAARKLSKMTIAQIEGDIKEKPILQEFTDLLAANMKGMIREAMGVEIEANKPVPAIRIIADAYRNVEKYQDVWGQATTVGPLS